MRWTALALFAAVCAGQPVRLHPDNPHYFLFGGKPAVFITSGEHYGAVLNGAFEFRRYLDTLSAAGLNYTRIFTGSYLEIPGSFGIERNTLAPAAESFVAPWVRQNGKFDLDTWNTAYFDRLKSFVTEAGKRGVVVEVTLFCSTYGEPQWKASPFHPANNNHAFQLAGYKRLNTPGNGGVLPFQEKLTRKIVGELNAFDNVIFEIQNEPWADRPFVAGVINPYLRVPARDMWPNSVDLADAASLEWQTRVSDWITSTEARLPKRHLIAQNVSNFRYAVRETVRGVSIVNFHYAFPEAATWNLWLNKAIGCDETGFIGKEDGAYRRQAWNFIVSGGSLFNHLDYSFSPGHEDGSDSQPASPGGGSAALRRQLGILSRIMNELPFLSMRPDAGAVACEGCVARTLSAPGRAYLVFVEGASPATLQLHLAPGTYEAVWVYTTSGQRSPIALAIAGGRTVSLPSPRFDEDIALVLKAMN